jgi:hypothetical protein
MPNRHSNIAPNETIFSRDGLNWERPYRDVESGLWSYADPFEYQGDLCLVAHKERDLVLGRMRRDGLASVGAAAWGNFRTHEFAMPKGELQLNADCQRGAIEVDLLRNGEAVDSCSLSGVDGTGLPLVWEREASAELAGQSVSLQVGLAQARVYALTSDE